MIVNYSEIFILSLIQGISEFLPVSSSAHLFLVSHLHNFENESLLIDISCHFGSLIAILFYFRKEFKNIHKQKKIIQLLVIGSIPLFIVGLILHQSGLIGLFRNLNIIAWTTALFAILLLIADKFESKRKIEKDINLKNILVIGCFQILALVPGVSRSGIIITAGRFLKFNRYEATKISFYLSIPAIAGASFLGFKELINQNLDFNILAFISIILSFVFSYLTIKYFLIFVKKFNLNVFVFYRLIVSIILFFLIYS